MASQRRKKGHLTEELLRAYFIRAGLYAVRSVPLKLGGDDLTDVDIWLYERPTGSSCRTQIVDAKSKTKPKAVERLFWTKGVYEMLGVDGAYIATTDTRPLLKEISNRLGILVLDGTDIKRMEESASVIFPDRIHEEDLEGAIRAIDKTKRNRRLLTCYHDLKAGLIDKFGPGTVNRALEHFNEFATKCVESHPNGQAAEVALRLSYLAASVSAIAIDKVLTSVSFKSAAEKRRHLTNVIRYGDSNEQRGLKSLRIAAALIEKYAPNGRALSKAVSNAASRDYEKIPAEDVAEYILTRFRASSLFQVARALESRAFNKVLQGFDTLDLEEKSLLAALLDFSGVDRVRFATSWILKTKEATQRVNENDVEAGNSGPLFEHRSSQ